MSELREFTEEQALKIMQMYPDWLTEFDYVTNHQARAVFLGANKDIGVVLDFLCGGRTEILIKMKMPAIPFFSSPARDPGHQVTVDVLEEYGKILAKIDKEELKKRFHSKAHMLLDMRVIGSLLAGVSTTKLENFYQKYYAGKTIHRELVDVLGVKVSLVESDLDFPEEQKKTPSYNFQCSDGSFRIAVDEALRGQTMFDYSWKIGPDADRSAYFLRFDNRNTFFNELQRLEKDAIVVLGFMKKISLNERAEVERLWKAKFETIISLDIMNTDNGSVSVLRVQDVTPLLKALE